MRRTLRDRVRRLRTKLARRRGVRTIRRTGFWFVDIPRTSSTAIRAELGRRHGPAYGKANVLEAEHAMAQVFTDHMTAAEMRAMIGPDAWDALYVFTVVRNPWDRTASLYHYRRKAGEIPADWPFADYVRRMVEADDTTPHFRFRPLRLGAAEFVLDETGLLLVDEIVRFEDRAAGMARVGARIGLPELGGVRAQAASPADQSYRALYDDATRDLVATRFARDAALFDYAF